MKNIGKIKINNERRKMKISVIVPVYNRLEHLRALCLCLIKQEEKPDELIISDDGSSEKVMDFIEDLFPKMDFKVKHIYQKDLGFRKTRALNNAVREAKGEVLLFLDQDIILPFNLVEKVMQTIRKDYFLPFKVYYMSEEEKNKFMVKNSECKFKYNEIELEDKKQIKKIKKKIF